MTLSKKWKIKVLIRLRGCASWSSPLLIANRRKQVFTRRGKPLFKHAGAAYYSGANGLIFSICFHLCPCLSCAKSEGSSELVRPGRSTCASVMLKLAWAFSARICDIYQNLVSWPINKKSDTIYQLRNMCFKINISFNFHRLDLKWAFILYIFSNGIGCFRKSRS